MRSTRGQDDQDADGHPELRNLYGLPFYDRAAIDLFGRFETEVYRAL